MTKYKAMTTDQLIEAAKATLVIKDDQPMISVPGKPAAALINEIKARKEEIKAELIRRKDEADVQRAECEARWEAERLARLEADKPLLEQMRREADALAATIPADHIRVTVTMVGSSDGNPILEYRVGDTKLNWQDVEHVGTANAFRPRTLSAFATEWVFSISSGKLAEIKGEQIVEADKKAAQDKELAETEIPADAISAYNKYKGDAGAAWEAEDTAAWAAINEWTPHIERQRGVHATKFARAINAAAREEAYGINEG